jgi:16S rRNA (uracil1498-N3)-methyltransferase
MPGGPCGSTVHRFHTPDLPDEGALLALPDEEARHLTQVLRLTIGDAVRVFDGHGREHHARVENAGRRRVEVRVGPPAAPAPEARTRITLAAALLKGDKFDDVVRDAAMLGAAVIQPLVTAHTDVPAARAGSTARLDRWRRVALSSTKQSGRAVIAEVAAPASIDERLRHLPSPWIVLAEPAIGKGGPLPARPETATVFVGPEGGWSAGEIAAFKDGGAHFLTLGGRTLRADAAPLVALSVLLYTWDGENLTNQCQPEQPEPA